MPESLSEVIGGFPKMGEEPKVETPKVETPAEPKIETPVSEPEKVQEAPVATDRLKILGETFGQEFKTDEDFKTYHSSLTEYESKYTEAQKKADELAALNAEYEKTFNPEGLFKSDKSKERFKNLVIHDQLISKMPDKDPEILFDVINRDYSNAHLSDPIDVLVRDEMLNNPDIYKTQEEAENTVLMRFGIDPEEKDEEGNIVIPDAKKRLMQVDAKKAITSWGEYKRQVEPAKDVNLAENLKAKRATEETRMNTIREATESLFTKQIPGDLKEIEIPITVKGEDGKETTEIAFKYEIGDGYPKSKMVQDTLNTIRNNFIQNGTEWNKQIEEKVRVQIVDELKAAYLYKNLPKIYAAIRDDLNTKFEDEAWTKRHNVRPLRSDGTIKRPTKEEADKTQGVMDAAKMIGIRNTDLTK